jgi:hypothetical protein
VLFAGGGGGTELFWFAISKFVEFLFVFDLKVLRDVPDYFPIF